MKHRLSLAVLVVVSLSLAAGNAFATCPTPYTGPTFAGPNTWATYSQDQACYSTSGNVSSSSISCFTEPSWSFGSGTSSVSASFTVGANDWVGNPAHWEADSWIDFSSSGGTSADRIEFDVDVTHPNSTVSHYTVIYWSGVNGSLSSCNGAYWNYFTADVGDTITVTIAATNSGSANIVATVPRIFTTSP
jgi:hypothetical protein